MGRFKTGGGKGRVKKTGSEDVTTEPKRRGRPPKVRPEIKKTVAVPKVEASGGEEGEVVLQVKKKRLGRPPKALKLLELQQKLKAEAMESKRGEKVESGEEDGKGSPRTVLRKRVGGSRRKGEPRRSAGAILEEPFVKPLQVKKRVKDEEPPPKSALPDPKRVPRKPNKFDDYTVPARAKPSSNASSIDTSETASEVSRKRKAAVEEEVILQRLAMRNQKSALGATTSR